MFGLGGGGGGAPAAIASPASAPLSATPLSPGLDARPPGTNLNILKSTFVNFCFFFVGLLAPSRQAHFPQWANVGGLDRLGALPLSLDCHQLTDGMPRANGGAVQTLSDDALLHIAYMKGEKD